MLQVLDAHAVRRWCTAGREGLAAARAEIDDLNVYPVPDGDTGTNLLLTMEAVEQAVLAAPADMAATVEAMARGALMGARGNSGVILSQLLRGLAEVFGAAETCSAATLQGALTRAAELCYAAVATPVEGTILTVARQSAHDAAALGPADLAAVVGEARAAAARSLARTPDLLPQLKAAGVVDAGGRGWCVLLEALERVVTGTGLVAVTALLAPRDCSGLSLAREAGSEQFGYEVQFLLSDATDGAVVRLKQVLGELGDALVVVGGDGLHNVHVHVDDIGAALEAAVEAGRPFRITVTRFADQMAAAAGAEPAHAEPALAERGRPGRNEPPVGRGVVAVVAGRGLAELYAQAGAVVVDGGPTANPSTTELVAAIRATAASEVVLLPNDANTLGVAAVAATTARAEGFVVAVVPTRSVVQGLAALAVADPTRPFADDVAAMAGAAGSTRWAEVTVAVRQSATTVGVCRPGDVLGLLEGDVALIGSDLEQVASDLLQRLLTGGGELVTLVVGAGAPAGVADRLASWVEQTYPAAELLAYDGGQPHYPLLLGVE